MKAWLERYLELTALAAVGGALLDPRPAFAVGDRGEMLWANDAGRALLHRRRMADIASDRGPEVALRTQLARLLRTLPEAGSRLEALCLPLGPVRANCKWIELADGGIAVLAVAESGPSPTSIASRARQLAGSLGSSGQRAGIFDGQDRWLAAPQGLDALVFDLDGLTRDAVVAAARDETVGRRGLRRIGGVMAVHFVADEEPLVLVVFDTRSEEMQDAAGPGLDRPDKSNDSKGFGEPETPRGAVNPVPVVAVAAAAAERASAAAVLAADPAVTVALITPPAADPVAAAEPVSLPLRAPSPAAPPHAEPLPFNPRSPSIPPVSERLSGTEADAFRRIREALGRNGVPPNPGSWQAAPAPPAPATFAERAAGAALPDDRTLPATLPAPPAALPFDEKLLDRLPLGIVVFRDRRTLFVNRAILDLLGYDSTEAFDAAGGVDQMFGEGTRAWAKGDFDDRDGRLAVLMRDGKPVPVEARLNTVTWAGETAFLLSVTPRAIGPEPEALPEVAPPERPPPPPPALNPTAAERRIHDLETILNTATDGVIVVDRHGTVESMNRAAEALFAVEAPDLKGRSFTELLAAESRKTALDYLDGLAANGVKSVLNDGREVIGRVPNGGLIPLSMTMGRLGDSGRFSAVMRDITHWKTAEDELTAARREAEAANAQKSEFLAKISHEIRTPLNAIIGFSEIMMEQRFGPIGNDRYRAYLSDIHVSGAHLMSLINDLLDLSKIEAGKVELTFEAVAVNVVIQETVALMQPLANRQRIIIRTSLGTELPNVVADQRSFRQILLNLLSNAIKFTRAGGQVIVSTLLEETGEVVVRIRDTGIGMTARDIETAMKPFEQVSETQGDRDNGTGLGLPLTKAMVEANRATFAIESAPNQGTLVRVTFPTTRVLAG